MTGSREPLETSPTEPRMMAAHDRADPPECHTDWSPRRPLRCGSVAFDARI